MSEQPNTRRITRREAIAGIGIGVAGVALAQGATRTQAQAPGAPEGGLMTRHATVAALRSHAALEGEWAETTGFFSPGDGGGALYQVRAAGSDLTANEADVIALANGMLAVLVEREAVNYRMFGAIGDGSNDDGVQIKLAHAYANLHKVPVINASGEFWIRQTNGITISTPVQWGMTIFHIEERYNTPGGHRFVVPSDEPAVDLSADEALKQALVEKLKPGVQIIPELAPYAGHLLIVLDEEDRIGMRAGERYTGQRGWAREELFYVEEEGRIIGDIAWEFKNLTSIRATPCGDHYLVIQGGGFRMSGETPEDGKSGYHSNGILIQRSRTVVREQWMGLEQGKRDMSVTARHGFYSLAAVYDVTLENIRAMPWEQNRPAPGTTVPQGTYGIGGARMLNCTFRNVTAEAGWVSWGVFGTNLNKNFRFENCRLNRVDVHFHCWNLAIVDSTIGFRGISVTGGGELLVQNTTRHGNNFVNFRRDFGSKWDGPIRLVGCTLKPSGNGEVSVLAMNPADFDYRYPVGFGTSVTIENLRIDYSAAPENADPCWLMSIPAFSVNREGERLFFPHRLTFRNIDVVGREQGVRVMRIADPRHYDVRRNGGVDDGGLRANCLLICEKVQLEKMVPGKPGEARAAHLAIGEEATGSEYEDERALFPRVVFEDCENVAVYLGEGCAAAVAMQRCSVTGVTAAGLRGELTFNECRLRPEAAEAGEPFYAVDSTLGTRFTNCTLHAPVVGGQAAPELVDRSGVLEMNGAVRHYHLNTALGPEVLKALRERGVTLTPEFIGKLKCHHALEG